MSSKSEDFFLHIRSVGRFSFVLKTRSKQCKIKLTEKCCLKMSNLLKHVFIYIELELRITKINIEN